MLPYYMVLYYSEVRSFWIVAAETMSLDEAMTVYQTAKNQHLRVKLIKCETLVEHDELNLHINKGI